MGGSSSHRGSRSNTNLTPLAVATVAVATASCTTILYRCYYWYKTKTEIGGDKPNSSNNNKNNKKNDDAKHKTSHADLLKPPLRNVTPRAGEASRIVYLTGIDKQTDPDQLVTLFSSGGSRPVEIDASEVAFRKGGGRAWALYATPQDAKATVAVLHGTIVHGCTLCARLEWGVHADGKRIPDTSSHTAILRGIQRRRGTPKTKGAAAAAAKTPPAASRKKNRKPPASSRTTTNKGKDRTTTHEAAAAVSEYGATYSHNSISIGEIEYPFPSGLYSTKLIQRLSTAIGPSSSPIQAHQREQEVQLLRLLSDVSILGCGSVHRYAKEVSEAFAMVDALERGIKRAFGVAPGDLPYSVTCYCLGDGKYPIGAAALELFLDKDTSRPWKFIAIDPLLPKPDNGNATGRFHDAIELYSGFSQDYRIETNDADCPTSRLSIAIACHSHAPLEEFWERLPRPKLCVSLPCCAQFSELPKETPLLEYENFEVYSPKRKIKIFASK